MFLPPAIAIFCVIFCSPKASTIYYLWFSLLLNILPAMPNNMLQEKCIRIFCVIIYLRDSFFHCSHVHDTLFTGFTLNEINGRKNTHNKKKSEKHIEWNCFIFMTTQTHTQKIFIATKNKWKIEEARHRFKNEMRIANERKKKIYNFLLESLISGRDDGTVCQSSVCDKNENSSSRPKCSSFHQYAPLDFKLTCMHFLWIYLFLLWYSCESRAYFRYIYVVQQSNGKI